MKMLKKLRLSWVVEKLDCFFEGAPVGVDESIALYPGCIARKYAGCTEYSQCRNCGTIEQALRAGSWVKLNWQRMGRRNAL